MHHPITHLALRHHRRRHRTVLTLAGLLLIPVLISPSVASQAHAAPTGTALAAGAQVRSMPVPQGGLPATETEPFGLLGAAWPAAANAAEHIEVRTRSTADGAWSAWRPLDAQAAQVSEGEPNGAREQRLVTGPLWVGASDAIEVQAAEGRTLPQGIDLTLVTPATARSEDASSPSPAPASPEARDLPTASLAAVGRPPITTRAEWGADENLPQPPSYSSDVKAVIVHHTGGTNAYNCADSAAIVQSIQAYHMADPDHLWNDLGYNFLIDKCGTIFEGRAGGIDQPVIGYHTPGFNTDTTGIALIGELDTAEPTPAAHDAIGRLAAYKLGLTDRDPLGTETLTATVDNGTYAAGEQATVPAIANPQDLVLTTSPGAKLLARLPTIRSFAASPAAAAATPTADIDRNGVIDLAAGVPEAAVGTHAGAGMITVLPGTTTGPDGTIRPITQNATGVPGSAEAGDAFGTDSAYGDVNGDGYADLVVSTPGEDDTAGIVDIGNVTVLDGPGLTTGASYSIPTAERVAGAKLGTAVSVGDFNSDGKADVFAIAPGAPATWWLRDSATGTITTGRLATSTAAAVTFPQAATGDFNRDGYTDAAVTYIDPDGTGRIMTFPGSAAGLQPGTRLNATGGRAIAAGDVNADGYTDIVIGQHNTPESGAFTGGQVTAFYGSATGITTTGATTLHQDSPGVPDTAEAGDSMGRSVSIGDYNNDGYADVLAGVPNEDITRDGVTYADAGTALLLNGSPSGLTGTGSHAISQDTPGVPDTAETTDRLGNAVSLTDLTGDTLADLTIGAGNEDNANGTILQIDTAPTGIQPTTGTYYGPAAIGAPTTSHIGNNLTP
ncbi:FG-GAP-like repeat-containing protein [Streptomyces sp. NPDC004134]|uniref:FG-GAP-like repeat-containing protein n=1 Tax=Streptomyces sp. NPDC004134 TaxID=3364691 RepID=UPI0036768BD1